MFYGAGVRNQTDGSKVRRAFHEEARAPIRDYSPSLSQSRPADRTSPASKQNIQHESTSAPHPQKSTCIGLVLQDNVARGKKNVRNPEYSGFRLFGRIEWVPPLKIKKLLRVMRRTGKQPWGIFY